MKTFSIGESQLDAIMIYLSKRPWEEVNAILQFLINIKQEQSQSEIAKKEE